MPTGSTFPSVFVPFLFQNFSSFLFWFVWLFEAQNLEVLLSLFTPKFLKRTYQQKKEVVSLSSNHRSIVVLGWKLIMPKGWAKLWLWSVFCSFSCYCCKSLSGDQTALG